MKFVQAGVSRKTNRPYAAFFKCNGCGNGVTAGQNPSPAPIAPPRAPQSPQVGNGEIILALEAIHEELVKIGGYLAHMANK